MRDLTFTGLKAHPIAVLIMFILASGIFCYGWIDMTTHLSQSQMLSRETFFAMLNDRSNGQGYLLSAIFTSLISLYALGSYKNHLIYRVVCYVSLVLAISFAVFLAWV
ncbi:hypothetical protein [Motilimonas eburnea]|uniref:hypothetical protein n=1 Tax=Motilimonas eburnea TaxID=1737488 RepID=UPI001E31D992|nr:hypothetical protein [Motilimonas eburnea]MCE2570121.1 hypothetical protein [Motilimonas eburnea]